MKNSEVKKKILFHYMLGIPSGGSDQCLFSLLTHLDQTKYELFLLYKRDSFFLEKLKEIGIKLIPITKQVESNNNQIVESKIELKKTNEKWKFLPISLKILIKIIPDTLKLINIIKANKIDIIHANHNINGDRAVILASIILRKKIVSHYRGLYTAVSIDKYLYPHIDQIICISNFAKQDYIKSGIPEKKCKIIYDGVDLNKFSPLIKETNKITIGCIGRLEKWKGQQVLIEAAGIIVKSFPEIEFLLIGNGSNKNNLLNKVKSENLEKHLTFTGDVTNVKDYMDKCTIIVHTSIEPEPFGMVIIEAMALEKPVIATNFGGPIEIIDNEIDGYLIPPSEPKILASHILKLVNNPELRKQIGTEARKKVIEKFDFRITAKKIENVYEDIQK
ncbi:MAG: glycosyltransferase family 4 protein [Ignavibacteriales bacterium]|nr:glycosyltransferase family 4 protein [Ignavibacteriales bacterium]MCB9210986.1 glycosyltransferase family 4 protein [Ignavibacteriales bacterium]